MTSKRENLIMDMQLTHDEEQMEAWHRDFEDEVVDVFANDFEDDDEIDAAEVLLQSASWATAGVLRHNEERPDFDDPDVVREWAKNLSWKELALECLYANQNHLFDAVENIKEDEMPDNDEQVNAIHIALLYSILRRKENKEFYK